MKSAILFLILAISTGCSHTAVVHCWEPAEIEVSGMHRIVVTDFVGDKGQGIAGSLSALLHDNEFYTIVDPSELQSKIVSVEYQDRPSMDDLISSARTAGVDGIIFGEVIEYDCNDQVLRSSELNLITQDSIDDNLFDNTQFDAQTNESLLREGSVTLSFRLVEVETGEVLAARSVNRNFSGRFDPDSTPLPSRGELLHELTESCLQEFVQMLAPHERPCEMSLATCDFWEKGSRNVRAGVKWALAGEWSKAEESWQRAIEENPQNHAALFNLSIAATRRQDYFAAETYALDAIKAEHKDCYTAGLEKIRERRKACEQATAQRDSRVSSVSPAILQR
ncbi:Curli production assembly/transport component CsgG [Thalassoglobus neptunius]|uniref:Curli production assembly/transport component CsgG n=1 Tax=Thalassoglobus neptunius TaxID=1938619 RepID=A0A5C5X4C0_9PLAN|nr:tetratricopeptide repeat protein [Thalassoglobus neptunius]TWT57045.1 Curli production assembly/transport component CsgG [Thalassoglobus neptunius]